MDYIGQWTSPETSPRYQAIEAIDQYQVPFDEPFDGVRGELIKAKCRALMVGYDKHWHDHAFEVEAVEHEFVATIMNPGTRHRSRTFQMAGKIDVLAWRRGSLVLIDHKTTSQDISDPNAAYWRQLEVDSQINHYLLGMWLLGCDIHEAVWDVVRKPSIAPRKLSKKERAALVEDPTYYGVRLSADLVELMQREERETVAMYEARLWRDCTEVRPEWYFQQRSVPRLGHEILEYAYELWQHTQDLLKARKQTFQVRNPNACLLYGTPCKFLPVCGGHDVIDSDRWTRKGRVHKELSLTDRDDDGRNLLTNSRIKCFQTCRRKHHYEYELGRERLDEEEKETLVFGHVWHAAQQAWWATFKKGTVRNGRPTEDGQAGGESPVVAG